ncbi:Smr/MutS family protein [Neomegalonema sp.]|uniref:Smr/MutS family protein n=1 Tax=Neomegalonema sp. TaxID=2039713 RepID=UPI00260AB016|nr:Smr/MutS family protein [Neomegalonema sp.]MDD2867098.1 Smr/MutS family protein [Neomegalonema sp.]
MRRKGRITTEEELQLWRAAMRDAEPLARRRRSAAPEEPPPEPRRPEPPVSRPDLLPLPDFSALFGAGPKAPPASAEPPFPRRTVVARPFVEPLGPRTPGLDRRTAQRLMKGEKRPEGRLDLHGLTLDHAHLELTLFILAARRAGKRMVLVVTGKGGDYQARALGREAQPGTLREAAPRWLDSPQLKPHVGGVYPAHDRHGGAGALYVYLRKS